jgi:voltage-dependent calcium channel T type alpha-1H
MLLCVLHSILMEKDALRQDDAPAVAKNQFITAIAPIYFVIFVLMAQFVLVNVVVAVLMKKLDVSDYSMNETLHEPLIYLSV